jgi:hypothetical protein
MRNRIARGIVTLLKLDVATYGDSGWAVIPQTIERYRGSRMESNPRPAIYVASQGTQQQEARAVGVNDLSHWARNKVLLTLMTADQSDPQGAICDLVTDVSRALALNRGMLSIDAPGEQTIQGRIVIGDDDLEAIDDDPADGICDLIVFVDFKWSPSAP